MITSGGGFGQGIPMSQRMPFRRPANAGFYTPRLAPTAFYSHINPFPQTMLPISAFRPGLPRMPRLIRPRYVSGGYSASGPMPPPGPQMDVTPRPQQIKGFGRAGFGAQGFRPRFAQVAPPPMYPTGMNGFGADAPAAAAAPPMVQPQPPSVQNIIANAHRRPSPYGPQNPFAARTARTGVWPAVQSTANGIRQGASGAAAAINRMRWGTFSNRAEIEGTIDPGAAY